MPLKPLKFIAQILLMHFVQAILFWITLPKFTQVSHYLLNKTCIIECEKVTARPTRYLKVQELKVSMYDKIYDVMIVDFFFYTWSYWSMHWIGDRW